MAYILPPSPADPWLSMFQDFARMQRAAQQRREWEKAQEQSAGSAGLGAGLGTALGTGIGALLAVPTGGLSVAAGAIIGAGIGGGLGGTAGTLIDPPVSGGSVDRGAQYGQAAGYLAQGTQAVLSGYQYDQQRNAAVEALMQAGQGVTGGGGMPPGADPSIAGIGGMPAYRPGVGETGAVAGTGIGGMTRDQAEKFVDAWGDPGQALQWVTKNRAQQQYQAQGQANRMVYQQQAHENSLAYLEANRQSINQARIDKQSIERYGTWPDAWVADNPTSQEFTERLTAMAPGRDRDALVEEYTKALPSEASREDRDLIGGFMQQILGQSDAKRQGMVQQDIARAQQTGQQIDQMDSQAASQAASRIRNQLGYTPELSRENSILWDQLEAGLKYIDEEASWRPPQKKAARQQILRTMDAIRRHPGGKQKRQPSLMQRALSGKDPDVVLDAERGLFLSRDPKGKTSFSHFDPPARHPRSQAEAQALADSRTVSIGGIPHIYNPKDGTFEAIESGVDFSKIFSEAYKRAERLLPKETETLEPREVTKDAIFKQIRLQQDVENTLKSPPSRLGRFARPPTPVGPRRAEGLPPLAAPMQAAPPGRSPQSQQGLLPVHQVAGQFLGQYDAAKGQGRMTPGAKMNAKTHAGQIAQALVAAIGTRPPSESERAILRRLREIIKGD